MRARTVRVPSRGTANAEPGDNKHRPGLERKDRAGPEQWDPAAPICNHRDYKLLPNNYSKTREDKPTEQVPGRNESERKRTISASYGRQQPQDRTGAKDRAGPDKRGSAAPRCNQTTPTKSIGASAPDQVPRTDESRLMRTIGLSAAEGAGACSEGGLWGSTAKSRSAAALGPNKADQPSIEARTSHPAESPGAGKASAPEA